MKQVVIDRLFVTIKWVIILLEISENGPIEGVLLCSFVFRNWIEIRRFCRLGYRILSRAQIKVVLQIWHVLA